jgi:hypothetical protein
MQTGMSLQVFPSADGSGDYLFQVSITRWNGTKAVDSKTVTMRNVSLMQPFPTNWDNTLWVLDALEIASQLVERDASIKSTRTVSGTNGYPVRAPETLSQDM